MKVNSGFLLDRWHGESISFGLLLDGRLQANNPAQKRLFGMWVQN